MVLALNERQRRQYAATLANMYGYGGATVVHEVTGISLNTITAGKRELENNSSANTHERVRRKGGGPKYAEEHHANIQELVREIVEDCTYGGDPERVLSWNKVEHRLFCFISKNREGKPLVDVQTAVNLIGATSTQTGLKVLCMPDNCVYELSKTVSAEEFKAIHISAVPPFEQWNYIIFKE
jgi:hypothetical protein